MQTLIEDFLEHLELREGVRSGAIPGPDLVVAGPIIEGEPPPELADVIAPEGRRRVATAEISSASSPSSPATT